MRKFLTLLKKEVLELLTPQVFLPLIIVVIAFSFIGKLADSEMNKMEEENISNILDLDNSQTTQFIIGNLETAGLKIKEIEDESRETSVLKLKSGDYESLIIFEKGFEESINKNEQAKLNLYTGFQGFSTFGAAKVQTTQQTATVVNEIASSVILSKNLSNVDATYAKNPVSIENLTSINGNEAKVNPMEVVNFITTQTTFIPIVLFVVITFASQLVATSIAEEKENKTLETLLTIPVKREFIVASKLIGAGLISFLAALGYVWGMRNYMTGLTGQSEKSSALKEALVSLNLEFSTQDYVLLALVLFGGILVALAIAFMLGAISKDTKSAQGMITPLMVMLLIPYMLTLMFDMNGLSPVLKNVVSLIPFTHTFTAAQNLILNKESTVIGGIVYVYALCFILMIASARFFASEKLITLELKLKKK